MTDLPRILLLSSSVFNPYSGGGITLTNLFKGWPKDSIAMVHQDNILPDNSVCDNFYRLGPEEVGFFWPLRLLQRERSDVELREMQLNAEGESSEEPRTNGWRTLAKRAAFATLRSLDESRMLAESVRISAGLMDWIRQFRPQVLYTLLGDLTYLRLTRRLAAEFSLPVVIHIMDDWPSTRYSRGILSRWLRREMNREFQALNENAVLRMAICQDMSEEYQRRYGQPYMPFHNALELERWARSSKTDWDCGKPFKLVYSGSMEEVQIDAIRDICRVVGELNDSGADVVFHIHTPWFYAARYRQELSNPPQVCMRDVPESAEDMAQILASADALVLAYNFDAEATTYFRYSMPTKVPAYMISGSPVLAYGPGETAAMRYASSDGWGLSVAEPNRHKLREALESLMVDQELRERLGRHAQKLATQNHDARRVRGHFQKALAGVV